MMNVSIDFTVIAMCVFGIWTNVNVL